MLNVRIRGRDIYVGTTADWDRLFTHGTPKEIPSYLIISRPLDLVILTNGYSLGEWVTITGYTTTFDYARPMQWDQEYRERHGTSPDTWVWAYPPGDIFGHAEDLMSYARVLQLHKEILHEVLEGRFTPQGDAG
jgi:hypothetical protein